MGADWTNFRSGLSDNDVSAVGALPYGISLAAEHDFVFNVLEQFAVAFLMVFLDGSHHFEFCCDSFKALFAGSLCKSGIHVGPFIVFARSGILEVFFR